MDKGVIALGKQQAEGKTVSVDKTQHDTTTEQVMEG